MEKLDLNVALASKESGEENGDFENSEISWIVGQVPGASRYIYCSTTSGGICIWDLYERRCARVIETGSIISCQHFNWI